MNALEAAERRLAGSSWRSGFLVWRIENIGGKHYRWRDCYYLAGRDAWKGYLSLVETDARGCDIRTLARCDYFMEHGKLDRQSLDSYWAFNEQCREIMDGKRWAA